MKGQRLIQTSTTAAPQADFPLLSREIDGRPLIYLDNASTSLRPASVLASIQSFYTDIGANIHRGKHILSEEASDLYEHTRFQVAEYVGAQPAEIIFLRNTTEALNLAAGLILDPSDIVITTLDAHHSNILPWQARARLKMVPVLPSGQVDFEQFESALEGNPRVVALTACSNVTGVYSPIRQMAKLAKEYGAIVVVDAAQSLPHRPDIFRDAGVDLVAFSAHKMLGPTGVGVLCGTTEVLEQLKPLALGGGTVDWVDVDDYRLHAIPHCFEYGTPDIASVVGFGTALSYLEGLGSTVLADHDAAMAEALVAGCAECPGIRIVGGDPNLDRAGIISIEVPTLPNLDDVARALSDSFGVMSRSGHMCAQPLVDHLASGQVLRLSTYIYNSADDIRTAFDALERVVSRL